MSAKLRLIGPPLALLLLAAAASGCGGAGGGGEAEGAGLTKAQLVKQGDAICRKAVEREEQGLGEAYGEREAYPAGNQVKTEEKLIVSVALPVVEAEANELDALEASGREANELQAVAEELQAAIDQTKQDPSLVVEGASGPFVHFDELAKDFGFKDCGEL